MDYLNKVLGIKVTYSNVKIEHLPNFIVSRYRVQPVFIDKQKAIFLYPKTELEQVDALKKHIVRIQENMNLPVVLVLRGLSSRHKEYLIRDRIPFIVEEKQVYLPFMAMYLQERGIAEIQKRDAILPSAQVLLLYFIYNGAKELTTNQAAKDLEWTPTSISRASKQLEEFGLLQIRKMGVQRILTAENSPEELFQKAKDTLLNPIKRTVYVPKEYASTNLLESGCSALARYSMLNAPGVKCYATEKISQWQGVMTERLLDSRTQVSVEMWRYSPWKLAKQNRVDRLSLALALRENTDERVEDAVEEMLSELWKEIDGCRN